MISIRRSDVPIYLQDSEFYLSLSEEDDEEISLPINNVKLDDLVTDEASLRHLLSTLRFWAANSIPDGLYDSAMNPDHEFYASVASEFQVDLSYSMPLHSLRTTQLRDRLLVAVCSGSVELVKYLLSHGSKCDARLTKAAAGAGKLACLQYLHSIGCVWDSTTCISAVKNGHFECLKYAHLHGCPWPACHMAHYAAARGSLTCLKYVVENGCPPNTAMYYKLANIDAVDCVRYLHSLNVPFPADFIFHAVGENSLKCVEYALQQGCTFTDLLLIRVTSLECMQLLHDTKYQWTTKSAGIAARKGVEILRFLHERGCPLDESVYVESLHSLIVTSTYTPDIQSLIYAHQHGCPWSANTLLQAVQMGNLPAVEYMVTHDCPADGAATAEAARKGHLPILECLHRNNVPWDTRTTTHAADGNHLKCLKFACSNHCPMEEDICQIPAQRHHKEMVSYLCSIGCKSFPIIFYPQDD